MGGVAVVVSYGGETGGEARYDIYCRFWVGAWLCFADLNGIRDSQIEGAVCKQLNLAGTELVSQSS